jgi:2-dehydropantoate 2-reductase
MRGSSRITVVGAGGIGCALGYAMRRVGQPVVFVDTNSEKIAWGKRHGVSLAGQPALPADFQEFDSWEPEPCSTVLLCTKCYDNRAVLERLPANVTLIPVQNGFDSDLERHGHALEGIASFVSECEPGRTHTRITRPGHLHLGYRQRTEASHGDDLCFLSKYLAAGNLFSVRVVSDILPFKHAKLMYNAAIGPIAAAAGIDNGELLAHPVARGLFFDLLRENYAILSGAEVPLGKIGPFHPATVARILDCRPLARALSWAFYPSLKGTYCSMHADIPAGRTEIEQYNGYLIRLAGERPCPLNRRVYELVKKLEREHIIPRFELLTEIAA